MGFKVQFENGQTVEFDSQPTDADIEEAFQATKSQSSRVEDQLGKLGDYAKQGISELSGGLSDIAGMFLKPGTQPSSLAGEMLQGGAETAGTVATGAAAQIGGLAGGAKEYLKDPSKTFEQTYAESMDRMTYAPRTEFGQEGAKAVGEFFNRNVVPVAPMVLGGVGGAMSRAASLKHATKEMKKFTDTAPKKKAGPDVAGLAEKLDADRPVGPKDVPTPRVDIDLTKLERQAPERPGDEPFYVDPQAQAFRGDPNEPGARLGLERQTEAMDNALTHNETPVAKEPLGLLSKESFDASNEGPQIQGLQDHMQRQFKQELMEKAVSEHPFLRKAEERVTKQEELITKLSEQVEQGKAQAATLAREVKNLEYLEAALERTRANVSKGVGEGKAPVPFGFDRNASGGTPFNFRKQGGAVNPEVFKEGFEKIKELADGVKLRAYSDMGEFRIEALKDGVKVGETYMGPDFHNRAKSDERSLQPWVTKVDPAFQNKGIASEMYRFASQLGNDIIPSNQQTPSGKALWQSLQKNGLATREGDVFIPRHRQHWYDKGGPGGKQKGALQIDPGQVPQGRFLEDNPATKLPTIVPMKLSAERVVELAKNAKDVDQNWVQKASNLLTKGGLYQALKTDNVVVKYVFERVHEKESLARGDIQHYVHDKLATASRALNTQEKAQIVGILDIADRNQRPVSAEELRAHGFSKKQIAYAEIHREVMDKALEGLNKAREMAGKKPITKREAYAAMSATGDYRRLVYKLDDAGEKVVVGVVGSDFSRIADARAKKLEAEGYIIGEERYYGGVPKQKGSAQQAFVDALEFLADNDPRVKEFLDVLNDVTKQEAYDFLNMKKHTMQKKGVFGMEGRKPWLDAEKNAKEWMQSQIGYAESALKWGHISEAAKEVREVLNNPDIKMPEAKKWSEQYLQNAMGFNPSEMGRLLEHGVAAGMGQTGIGYSNVRGAVAASRKVANAVLLGLNPGFWLTNFVQPFAAMPGIKAYLVSKGLDANFDFGTGYSYIGKGAFTALRDKGMGTPTAFDRGLIDYAKRNHVYGSDLIEHSNRASKDLTYRADKTGNFIAGNIESSTRRVVFFGMAHMLHDNGLSVKNGLYEAAHNLTDMAMNNYSPTERPQIYNSMGPIGDLATNLSSYKHNEFSRLALFARQIAEEKSARPLAVQLATGVAMAGITGTIAFAEADWLYKQITKALGKPGNLTDVVLKMSEKNAVGGNKYALSHGGFSFLGLDMSKRLGLQDAIPNSTTDVVFPGGSKLGAIGAAGYEAIRHPSEMNAKRLAREAAPGGAAGLMDRAWFSKDTPKGELAMNRNSLEAQVYRNEADKRWKNFGLTGVNESVQKSKLYEQQYIKQAYADKRLPALNKARDEMFSKRRVSPETIQAYLKYEGDINTLMADLSRLQKEQNVPAKDLDLLRSSMSKSITSLKHAQRLQEAFKQ